MKKANEKTKLEDVFLLYANYSLKDDPENFYKIFGDILGEKYIKGILAFAKCKSPEEIYSLLPKPDDEIIPLLGFDWDRDDNGMIFRTKAYERGPLEKNPKKYFVSDVTWDNYRKFKRQLTFLLDVLEIIYGRRCYSSDGYFDYDKIKKLFYGEHCGRDKDIKKRVVGEKYFTGESRLKCYECDQLFFINILSEIVAGKEYSQIEGIIDIISCAALNVKNYINIVDAPRKKYSHKEILEKTNTIKSLNRSNQRSQYINYAHYFIPYRLAEFLMSHPRNRERIKICADCGKFYISKTFKPSKFCSDKCRRDYHNKKRIQSGEAAKYKRDKRKLGAKESYY